METPAANYEPFGKEWQKYVMSLDKKSIIQIFASVGRERDELKAINGELREALEWIGDIMLTSKDGGMAWCSVRDQPGAKEFFEKMKSALSKSKPSNP